MKAGMGDRQTDGRGDERLPDTVGKNGRVTEAELLDALEDLDHAEDRAQQARAGA